MIEQILQRRWSVRAFLLLLLAVSWVSSLAQTRNVTGQVTDGSNGEALPGVSILVKGTTLGTISDSDGNYNLAIASEADILVFSFVGYAKMEIPVTGKTVVNVALTPDVTQLEELVVVGYGEQKKSVVTGAISGVKGDDLQSMPLTRVEQSLQGRTSGLTITTESGQPGSAATVRIRGTTTINDSRPLFIVDGVQVDGGIDYLSQSDIESIEVLKDAASAAIYGARAANGVIIITTKQGKAGKLTVNYNGFYGIQQPWRTLNLLDAQEYATLRNEALVASGYPIEYADPSLLGKGTDWQKELFSTSAPMQNHEISLSSGNEKSTYFTSIGYWSQKGIVAPDKSQYNRLTMRFNSTHAITKAVKFGNNIGYTRTKTRGIGTNSEWGSPLNRAINIDPITPVVITDPTLYNVSPYSDQPVVRDRYGRPYGISNIVTSEILNPIAALQVTQGSNWSDKVVGNIFLEVEPLAGLKLRSSGGVDLAFWGNESFSPIFYLNSTNQNTLNDYTREFNRGLFWLVENTISYTKMFDKHNFTALIGNSAQRNYGEQHGGRREGIPVDNIDDASLGFFVPQENRDFWGSEYQTTLASYFGRLNYDFNEKYLLTAIIRRDGSSKFGPNNKYGNFPSVSAGWVTSREMFWPENKVINFLKIRGSYGITGNDRIGDFRYLSTVGGGRNYTIGSGAGETLVNGVSPNAISNPDLKWEETSQMNVGFEATLFNDFNVTFDYYIKKTTGMLLGIDVPWYVGNNGPVGNVADMENTGYELELGYQKMVRSVNISLNANISYLENEVVYLGADKEFLSGQTFGPQGVAITRTSIGRPIGYFYGFKTNGLFQTAEDVDTYRNSEGYLLQPDAKPGDIRFIDFNNDGQITNDDRTFIGDPTPNWTYGFTMSASWRNWDLTLFGQGVAGNDVFKAIRRFDLPTANWTTEALSRWTGPGTSNSFPRMAADDKNQNYSRSSDFYIEDGSYFRVKNLQIGFSLPKSIVSKVGLTKVRLYATGNNLFTFTNYTGFDPEIGGSSYGVDRGIYPQARAYLGGINVVF